MVERMNFVFVAMFLPGILPAYQSQGVVPLDETSRAGFLTVKVMDQFGHEVQNPIITLREQNRTTGAAGTVKPWKNGEKISFGTYAVSVTAAGHARIVDSLTFRESVSIVIFCARFGPAEVENLITVNVQPINASCSSAKLLPIFDATNRISREMFVSSVGNVVLTNVPSGDYALVLFEGSRVCRIVPVRVSGEPVQRINILQSAVELR